MKYVVLRFFNENIGVCVHSHHCSSLVAKENSTFVVDSCERMTVCGKVYLGQRIRWVLLDQIGAVTRRAINAPSVTSVELRMTINGPIEATEVTRARADGKPVLPSSFCCW